MRIFYVNVIEQNVAWGAEWFMNKALRALGHITYCVDYRNNRHQLCIRFLSAPESDVFLLQRGDDFPIPLIRAVQIPRLFWASELVSRCRDQDKVLLSGLFDHIFFRTHACIERATESGWVERNNCSVLRSGFDETFHRHMPGVRKDMDVLFVGSITPRRKKILDRINSHYNLTVAIAFGEEMVKLVNRAKIVLNIHADDFLDVETRVFEVLGSGAFLLTERLSSENPFSRQDLVQFDTVDDLVKKIQHFLAHEEEREAIAVHGHASALNGHTYMHRAQEVAEVMSRYVTSQTGALRPMIKQSVGLHLYSLCEASLRLKQRGKEQGRALIAKGKTLGKTLMQRQPI